ncbi:outer membrane receptor protein involved in Fe transport [Novosphingobium sp. PhB165]|uniref:TonB-dependent receptor plug domain-containing protein n=1 Tax=Novosphingobium sp. PhB165 TaxID=2485105 RepID=UPI00104CE2AF|nr:TonB-dependent receptor [Novosphingobium sp. PhB165]TCM16604.1 outer membrane receptor protein involved in Fe transport [Novosphingobium sp. PhB165]
MSASRWASLGAVCAVGAFAAGSAQAQDFRIAPGRLGDVAASLGAQARITVAVPDPEVASRLSPGVKGKVSIRTAIDRILEGTGARAVFHDARTISIVAQAVPRAPVSSSSEGPPEARGKDIIVSASKQQLTVDTYPGSVDVLELPAHWSAARAAQGSAAITALEPSLAATDLGPGRNKLFIRGIADSSFNGQTQATVGEYLGNVRLNYNAPDPDLDLYDIKRVEVLVGPQGALYGAGSLGGIIRLVPNVPDSSAFAVTAAANLGFTEHGGVSRDGAGMLNVPLADGVAGRFVVFGGVAAGYIDAPEQGRKNINSVRRYGQRASLRTDNLAGWTLDLGFVFQNITGDDGQYTLRGDPPLTRNDPIPQPFVNNYRLGYVEARRMIGSLELNSTTSLGFHQLRATFDATGYDRTDTPTKYDERNDIVLFSHETRIAGGSAPSPWVAGASVVVNSSVLSRGLSSAEVSYDIPGVVNEQAEMALFGQISRPLTSTLTGTVGGRLTFSDNKGYLTGSGFDDFPETRRRAVRFSGTLSLDWHPDGPISGFFHYQQGYRAGGLGFGLAENGIESQRFDADDLHMNELGVRVGDPATDRLTVRAAVFFAIWNNIQADLVGTSGFLYTANMGQGFIHGLDGELTWRPRRDVTVTGSAFLNNSRVSKLSSDIVIVDEKGDIGRTLPNVARSGARLAAEWGSDLGPRTRLEVSGSVRYVGRSQLGIGVPLDVTQGGYAEADISAHVAFGHFGVTLGVDNLTDTRGNTFAFGNPFGLWRRDQITPLRPRTIRLGIDAAF